jgi:hypothetical protein
MKQKIFFVLCILLVAAEGCYFDKENELYGVSKPCNAGTVTYSQTITALINQYGCLNCHSSNNPSANINLQSYTAVKAQADNGRLSGAINHTPGFAPMPMGGFKMSDCDLKKVKAWIDAGSPNN